MAKIYNDNARGRIKRSVEWTERHRTDRSRRTHRRDVPMPSLITAVALEEIDNKEFGQAAIAVTQTFDSSFGAGRSITVYNPGSKFGLGAELIVQRAAITGAATDVDAVKYVVIEAHPRDSEETPGGNFSRVFVTVTSNDDLSAGPTDTAAPLPFANSGQVIGANADIAFDIATGEFTLNAGNYVFTMDCAVDNESALADKYPSGHPLEGNFLMGRARVFFQEFDGLNWVQAGWSGYGFPGVGNMAQTATLHLRYQATISGQRLRPMLSAFTGDSADASIRCFFTSIHVDILG